MTTAATRARWKLAETLMTAYGLGLLGSALGVSIMTTYTLTLAQGTTAALGLFFHAAALYIAPKGEKA